MAATWMPIRSCRVRAHLLPIAGMLALLAAASQLHAQAAPPPADRWRTALELGLTAAAGNESFVILTSGARVRRLETERFELELDTQLRYGRSAGRDIARKAAAGLKFDLHPHATWSPFLFALAEHDGIRSLELRLQSGAGVKRTLWRDTTAELSLSLAALYDREDLQLRPPAATARWSWRAKAEKRFTGGVRLEHATFYQPVWDTPGDYQLRARTALNTRITELVSIALAYSYERDASPPDGVTPDDHLVTIGVNIEF